MKSLLKIHGLILLIMPSILSYKDQCHKNILFGTKTPYKLVENLNVNITYPEKCFPLQINMVHRHGNRYPSAKDVAKMDIAINKINDQYEKTNIKTNVGIELPLKHLFTVDTDKLLSHTGEKELYDIGKRIKYRFPSIFEKKYSPLSYTFKSSCKLRCTHSANSLAAGLFEYTGVLGKCGLQPIAIEMSPCSNDPILRFFEMCSKYIKDVLDNKSALKEYKLFAEGPEILSVIEKMKLRLGFSDLSLKPDDVLPLFLLCAYDIGMYNGDINKGICKLFDKADLQILEYWYDLKHFYKRAAGYEITYTSSCKLLEDMYLSLKDAKENVKHMKNGIFRSAHAETIIPFFTLLGLFDIQERLKHDNLKDMFERSFRSGCTSPFSGNLYFVLYKCNEKNVESDYKIEMFVNEHRTPIPCCQNELTCDFKVFLKCYERIIETCHLGKMCDHSKHEL